jgi:TolB-like protein/predicted Zn-dependent protease
MSLIAELKRRKVLRMAGSYLVGSWLIVQVASTVLPMFTAPAWLPRTIVVVLAIGFIPALVLWWSSGAALRGGGTANLGLVAELRRRNVFRMAGLYLVGAWLAVQVAGTLLPMFDAPTWLPRTVVIVLAVLLIPVLAFSWVFELTPEGLKFESEVDRTETITPATGRKLDRIIMLMLALALAFFAFDRFVFAPRREAVQVQHQALAVAEARKQGGVEALIQSYGDKSIAVLPFVNMSSDKDQEYFADGITEELLNLLVQVPQLRVIARASSFAFKDKNLDVTEIAKRLSVVHILEGSCRTSGDRVRITAQLIDARTGTQLWSENYDRKLDDVLAVQDEIAAAVVAQLKLKMLARSTPPRKTNPKVHTLVMQARQVASLGTAEGLDQSYALLKKALVIDPNDPMVWDNVAYYYEWQPFLDRMTQSKAHKLAREATAKALAADPEFARGHSRLGELAMEEGDLAAAASHVQRALALEPTSSAALATASDLLAYLGRKNESIAISEYLTSEDPVNPSTLSNLGVSYLEAGRYDDAKAAFSTVLVLSPGRRLAQYGLIKTLLAMRKPQEAIAVIKDLENKDWQEHFMVIANHAMGKQHESDIALAEMIKKFGGNGQLSIAEMLASRGDVDQAYAWLDKLPTEKQPFFYAADDAELANLKKDPRWPPFLRKIGRAPEQLAAIKFEAKLPDASMGLTL